MGERHQVLTTCKSCHGGCGVIATGFSFLEPMRALSVYPFGVLHLHAPSLHIAELLADVPNIRAINIYFDAPGVTLQAAMPVLERLQARANREPIIRLPLFLSR